MTFFKKNFQLLRESRGLTLDDVAAACKCTKQTVQKWEKHPSLKPRPAKIPALCKILNCLESDLVHYGPVEKAMIDYNSKAEAVKSLLFGADVFDQIADIQRAVQRRDTLSKKDPNFAAAVADENAEIQDNLRSMFQKICRQLKVADLPENAFDDFRFGLLRALIKSDLPAEAKDKALQVVESYHP